MKLLIVYGTTEGQTRKICEFLEKEVEERDHTVRLYDSTRTDSSPNPVGYDAVIVADSVHAVEFQNSVRHFAEKRQQVLNKVPGMLVSVSLAAATDEPESWEELKSISRKFFEKTKWHLELTEHVAGALRYTKYNFFKKFIMSLIAQKGSGDIDTSQDYEYTDWDQIKRLLPKLEKELKESKDTEIKARKVR